MAVTAATQAALMLALGLLMVLAGTKVRLLEWRPRRRDVHRSRRLRR